MMSRWFAKPSLARLGAVTLGALLFVGCGGGSENSSGIRIGFSQIGAESDWRRANTESIKAAAKERGIELVFSDAQQKQENQIKALRNFIVQQVDVIAFSPVVKTGWEPVLEEIRDAGIPVVLTDRMVEVSDPELFRTVIGADFVEEGRRAAQWLVEASGGEAKIAELQGTPGSAPALDRKRGFEEVIAAHPGLEVIKSQTGEFTRAKGRQVMETFLKSPEGNEITALFAHNDDMALGAIQAIEEAGLLPGHDILIVSIDGVRSALEAIRDGKINCSVECNPLLGNHLMDTVESIVAGRPVERRIFTEEIVFTLENTLAALPQRQY